MDNRREVRTMELEVILRSYEFSTLSLPLSFSISFSYNFFSLLHQLSFHRFDVSYSSLSPTNPFQYRSPSLLSPSFAFDTVESYDVTSIS